MIGRVLAIVALLALACLGLAPRASAQRVIDREWGPSEDSVYVEVDVPGLKSAWAWVLDQPAA